MRLKIMSALGGAVALALTGCGSIAANPCAVWQTNAGIPTQATSHYLARYTLKGTPTGTCGTVAATEYDGINSEQYASTKSFDFLPDVFAYFLGGGVDGAVHQYPDTTHSPNAVGTFGNEGLVDANNECAAAVVTPSEQDLASVGGPHIKYVFSDVTFYETAWAQGNEFKATLTRTVDGCTATYDVLALAPEVDCATDADCNPLIDPAAGRFAPSGIAPQFHTFCDLSAAAKAWTGTSKGVCFLADDYPSACPEGEIEGDPSSSCKLGKTASATP